MPHAAFYVVELLKEFVILVERRSFNAARGFLCGGTSIISSHPITILSFNAARGFLCGGTS